MTSLILLAAVQLWQPVASMKTPGWGMACAVVNGKVFCIGGKFDRNDSLVPRLAVEAYDPVRNSWDTAYAPLPAAHCYPGSAVLDGKIYVVAGSDGSHDIARVDRFDPASNHWDTVASLPTARNALAACEFQGVLYAVGGLVEQHQGDPFGSFRRNAWQYVPNDGPGSWIPVDSLCTPRACLGLVEAGGRLNAVGGIYYSNLKSVEYYVPNAWNGDARMMLSARAGLAAVSYGSLIIAIAGFGTNNVMQSSTEQLDVEYGWWTHGPNLDQPRAYLSAAVVGHKIFVIGGMDPWWNAIGSVLVDSSMLTDIAEPQDPAPQPLAPTFASVVRGRARIDCGADARVQIYTDAGSLVCEGSGATEAELAPGVYFVRATTAGRTRTGRVTVIR